MWQGSCTPLSIPTKNDYELCIRYLEETVVLLLAEKEQHSFSSVSSTPLGGSFQYSINRGLVPLLSKTTAMSLATNWQSRCPIMLYIQPCRRTFGAAHKPPVTQTCPPITQNQPTLETNPHSKTNLHSAIDSFPLASTPDSTETSTSLMPSGAHASHTIRTQRSESANVVEPNNSSSLDNTHAAPAAVIDMIPGQEREYAQGLGPTEKKSQDEQVFTVIGSGTNGVVVRAKIQMTKTARDLKVHIYEKHLLETKGENALMNDRATVDQEIKNWKKLIKAHLEITRKWAEETSSAELSPFLCSRSYFLNYLPSPPSCIAHVRSLPFFLRGNQDPYVRGRMIYDRKGRVLPNGLVTFKYPTTESKAKNATLIEEEIQEVGDHWRVLPQPFLLGT
ncbi:hypothetical protein H4Q26_009422 [Puccinia striiformis f. sp. tritici PST-130]|nr:hypothetical protein H4Q26_009422 [Puccinia striiformis f. sp. tritici PST-130]